MNKGEVEVAGEQQERDVHQAVVEDHGAREAVARVLLAEPEQKTGHAEQDGEGGGERSVDLLAGVEPSLRSAAAAEPAEVVALLSAETAAVVPA